MIASVVFRMSSPCYWEQCTEIFGVSWRVAGRMFRSRMLLTMLGVALAFPLSAAKVADPSSLDEVIKKVQETQRKTTTLQADFRQEKTLALLAKPEVSTGTFVYSKPNNVLWSYDAPKRVQMLITS